MTLRPTNGVTISEHEQGSDGWRADRCGVFTASPAGSLMCRTKAGQPKADRADYINQIALERLTGELPDFIETAHMREGKEREPVAALAYSFATNNEVVETNFWYKDYYGASPDRLLVGQKGGVEIKNPKPNTHYQTLISKQIPPYYYWQILQCMLVTGAEFWDYVSYHPAFPPAAQLFIKRIERKDEQVGKDLLALRTELSTANKEVEELVAFINSYGVEKGEVA